MSIHKTIAIPNEIHILTWEFLNKIPFKSLPRHLVDRLSDDDRSFIEKIEKSSEEIKKIMSHTPYLIVGFHRTTGENAIKIIRQGYHSTHGRLHCARTFGDSKVNDCYGKAILMLVKRFKDQENYAYDYFSESNIALIPKYNGYSGLDFLPFAYDFNSTESYHKEGKRLEDYPDRTQYD